ncbi:MAG TPA: LysM peptidoglycan-binding domain-containing protein [Verrucomicrobiae bacterium]|nr:LysM peptidoglycan-binding domain-containing protein [Verrucomicrobiae bacterium]
MSCMRVARHGAIGLLLCVSLSGCGDNQLDEQKEPHFLAGKNCVSAMDYKGAVEAYEKALEVNPHSASAHLELGLLYETRQEDPAAAIYHYGQFLKLQPASDKAALVRDRINNCKVKLVETVAYFGPNNQILQHDLEKARLDNEKLKAQLAQWQAYYASHVAAPTNPPVSNSPPVRTASDPASASAAPIARAGSIQPALSSSSRQALAAGATGKTHTVKAGENPSAIARKYGISLGALEAANPQMKPNRLQVGQTLNIPAR